MLNYMFISRQFTENKWGRAAARFIRVRWHAKCSACLFQVSFFIAALSRILYRIRDKSHTVFLNSLCFEAKLTILSNFKKKYILCKKGHPVSNN